MVELILDKNRGMSDLDTVELTTIRKDDVDVISIAATSLNIGNTIWDIEVATRIDSIYVAKKFTIYNPSYKKVMLGFVHTLMSIVDDMEDISSVDEGWLIDTVHDMDVSVEKPDDMVKVGDTKVVDSISYTIYTKQI